MTSEPGDAAPPDIVRHHRSPAAVLGGSQLFSPGVPVNPFESNLINTLHLPTFSPSVFAPPAMTPESQKKAPKPFSWTIETVAETNPADIGEPVGFQRDAGQYDVTQEEQIQKTISAFFSTDLVAPSPLHQPAPAYNLLEAGPADMSCNSRGSPQNAACQTNLSVPPHVDIGNLLGEYMLSDVQLEEAMSRQSSCDSSLSASSLRRKLFHHNFLSDDEDGGTIGSCKEAAVSMLAVEQSPVPPLTHRSVWKHVQGTPQIASSPLVLPCGSAAVRCDLRHVTRQRTCSIDSSTMASPEMSPIDIPRTPIYGPKLDGKGSHNVRVAGPTSTDECIQSPMSAKPSRRPASANANTKKPNDRIGCFREAEGHSVARAGQPCSHGDTPAGASHQSSGSDTGYCTGVLQVTSQDARSMHAAGIAAAHKSFATVSGGQLSTENAQGLHAAIAAHPMQITMNGEQANITWHPSSYSTPQKVDGHLTNFTKPHA